VVGEALFPAQSSVGAADDNATKLSSLGVRSLSV
jgi:hypothetical protein